MRATNMLLRATIIALLISPLLFAQDAKTLSGTVTTLDGKPIADVEVYSGPGRPCCGATTNEKGEFHVVQDGDVLHFRKDLFEPQAIVIKAGVTEYHPTMAPAANDMTIPVCPKLRTGEVEVGSGFPGIRLILDQQSKVRTEIQDEKEPLLGYESFTISLQDREASLHLFTGPNTFQQGQDDEAIAGSSDFAQRNILMPNRTPMGTEIRGHLASGHAWRLIGVYDLGMAVYYDQDEADAQFFDHILNSVCLARLQ